MRNVLPEFLIFFNPCNVRYLMYTIILCIHCFIAEKCISPKHWNKNQILTMLMQIFYVLYFPILSYTNTFHFLHSALTLLVVEISCTTKFCKAQWLLQCIKEQSNASQEIFHSFFSFFAPFHCLITNLFCEHSRCYNFWMQQKCNWDY